MAIFVFFLFQLTLFFIGFWGPWRDANTKGHLARPIRMLLSFSLLVAAFAIWLGGAKLPIYAQWVAFGMFASFIGDLIMARLIRLPNRLIAGMIAFTIAHALYINAYTQTMQIISSIEPYNRFNIGLLAGLLFYCSLVLFGWLYLVRQSRHARIIKIGSMVYLLWVCTMASFALALGYALGFWLTAIGGLLFVISDFIVVVRDVGDKRIQNVNDWVWLTYVGAQMGIIYSSIQ